ncbi:hypothetical protein HAX54_029854, partial [Datura stramonium]|nr:hypothetical protein [Datura stramonium]
RGQEYKASKPLPKTHISPMLSSQDRCETWCGTRCALLISCKDRLINLAPFAALHCVLAVVAGAHALSF